MHKRIIELEAQIERDAKALEELRASAIASIDRMHGKTLEWIEKYFKMRTRKTLWSIAFIIVAVPHTIRFSLMLWDWINK